MQESDESAIEGCAASVIMQYIHAVQMLILNEEATLVYTWKVVELM